MRIELCLFRFSFELGSRVTVKSKQLAAYAKKFAVNRAAADEACVKRNRILDDAFSQLQKDVICEFDAQINDLNQEPDCAGVLTFTKDQLEVYRADDRNVCISIKFDAPARIVTLKCSNPVKFKRLISVRLNNDETNWHYVVGETTESLSPCKQQIDWIVDQGLYALFGVLKS